MGKKWLEERKAKGKFQARQSEARGDGMMAKKLCPFLMMKHDEAFKCNCQKESCVWWIQGAGGINIAACSIRVLAENLFFIQEYSKRGK